MKFLVYLILFSNIYIFSDELSVFLAGDLNDKKPYGLTSVEKHILKNKNELSDVDIQLTVFKNKFIKFEERIDGILSLYESDTKKLNSNYLDIKNIKHTINVYNDKINYLNNIVEKQKQIILDNNANIKVLKSTISKLSNIVNNININYLSRKDFDQNINRYDKSIKKYFKNISNEKESFKSKSKKELLIEVKSLFEKDYFTKAIPILNYFLEINYKLAYTNYILGEINYYRKNYSKAIDHFKKSVLIDDQALYMSKLLLHTAISSKKTKDLDNARLFYDTVIKLYPDSNESKIAKKDLSILSNN